MARLGETDGDVRAWVALADERMYTQKRETQQAVLADLDERRRQIS